MEFVFLSLLLVSLFVALGSGFPVAFAIPGSAILAVAVAALAGYVFAGDLNAYFTHGGGPGEWLSAGVINIRRIYQSDESDVLIAIPLFIFMGLMLQRSKVAEDLLLAMAKLFGTLRGGLGISVVLVGGLLAATTSVIGATVITMGMISLPTMLRNNYSKPLATGIVAATGTLGQIVPPSIVLIILNHQLTSAVYQANTARRELYKSTGGEGPMPSVFDVSSVSVGEMFMGALVPGLLLISLYILFQLGVAIIRPSMAPAVGNSDTDQSSALMQMLLALVPPLALIFLVLGSIISGIATVNQAGAIGAAGATVMAGYRLREGERRALWPMIIAIASSSALAVILAVFDVNLRKVHTQEDVVGIILATVASSVLTFAILWSGWRALKLEGTLRHVVNESTKTTAMVFAILLGAVMLTAAFRAFGGEDLVREFLATIPGGFWGQFAVIMLVIFALGFFLDFIEIIIVVVPIVAPIILADPSANVSALWLGVMLALVVQTSFLTPPFGFALFYLRGVAPSSVKTVEIYKGVIPFIGLQLVAIVLVVAFPVLVNYLPTRVLLLADSTPPTTNPRLQACMENFVDQEFSRDGQAIKAAITSARSMNVSVLPPNLRNKLIAGLDKADQAFNAIQRIRSTERDVAEAGDAYRPVLARVRALERDIRKIDAELAQLDIETSRVGQTLSDKRREEIRRRKAELVAGRVSLTEEIPPDWNKVQKQFRSILAAEATARRDYRRTVDEAYEPVKNILPLLADVQRLRGVVPSVQGLRDIAESGPGFIMIDRIKSVRSALAEIQGANQISSYLYKATRKLKGNSPDRALAAELISEAAVELDREVKWRARAAQQFLPELIAYDRAIKDTIGLRGQPRLPDHVAKDVAICTSQARDIFLNF
jgi:tripartite ATP-independent transporter DctM subunit